MNDPHNDLTTPTRLIEGIALTVVVIGLIGILAYFAGGAS